MTTSIIKARIVILAAAVGASLASVCGAQAVAPTAAQAVAPVAAPDIDPALKIAAQHVAVSTCATCHGPQGRSATPKFPVLAGQHAGYLAAQLKAFKAQTRGDPDALGYMWGMAAPLDEDMMTALAAYYSAQTPIQGTRGEAGEVARGADIYANGVAADGIPPCVSCHGPNAAGTAEFPRLAGQRAPYLLKQLHSFQNNMRNVAVMHGVAQGLKAPAMQAVAAYLQSLSTS